VSVGGQGQQQAAAKPGPGILRPGACRYAACKRVACAAYREDVWVSPGMTAGTNVLAVIATLPGAINRRERPELPAVPVYVDGE
jgi:hypothetical protein